MAKFIHGLQFNNLRGVLFGGLTVAVVALPLALALVAVTPLAQAADVRPMLSLPLDCGGDIPCMVQHYVDRDPGPDARDFMCGGLTYDGHKGTDFRLTDLRQMEKGVAVRASAAGVVVGVRNDFPEHRIEDFDRAKVKGRECGNGVVLDHGGDWTTQYCHMRRGSISVAKGQRLNAGEKIGLIGLSGETTFPHVHLSVRHRGRPVDPYTVGADADEADQCGQTGEGLWTAAARKAVPYRAAGVIRAGFSKEMPTLKTIREGRHDEDVLAANISKLIFWVQIFGLQAGDVEEYVIVGPGGKRFLSYRRKPAAKALPVWFGAAGKALKLRPAWPTGIYRAAYRLRRTVNGKATTVIEFEKRLTLN